MQPSGIGRLDCSSAIWLHLLLIRMRLLAEGRAWCAWQNAASRPVDLDCNNSACAASWAVSLLNAPVLCLQVQGDFVEKAAELIVKTYKDKGVTKKHVFAVVDKKTVAMFDEEDEDEQ